jgi:hypothetical protein
METDEERPRKKHPISISKLSKTPSWIMLGFVLGALFIIALPDDPPPTPPARPEPAKPATPVPPQLTTIEAVFEDPRWQEFMMWSNDTTELAFWNAGTRGFTDFFEVRRVGGVHYFRSLTALTRPIFNNPRKPVPEDCPLRFTAALAEEVLREWAETRRPEPAARREWKPLPQQAPTVELRASAPERVALPPPKIEIDPKAPGSSEK